VPASPSERVELCLTRSGGLPPTGDDNDDDNESTHAHQILRSVPGESGGLPPAKLRIPSNTGTPELQEEEDESEIDVLRSATGQSCLPHLSTQNSRTNPNFDTDAAGVAGVALLLDAAAAGTHPVAAGAPELAGSGYNSKSATGHGCLPHFTTLNSRKLRNFNPDNAGVDPDNAGVDPDDAGVLPPPDVRPPGYNNEIATGYSILPQYATQNARKFQNFDPDVAGVHEHLPGVPERPPGSPNVLLSPDVLPSLDVLPSVDARPSGYNDKRFLDVDAEDPKEQLEQEEISGKKCEKKGVSRPEELPFLESFASTLVSAHRRRRSRN